MPRRGLSPPVSDSPKAGDIQQLGPCCCLFRADCVVIDLPVSCIPKESIINFVQTGVLEFFPSEVQILGMGLYARR